MRKEKLEELKSYIEELKTIRRIQSDEIPKFLTVERYNYTLNNGIVLPKEKIIKGGSDGSASIILPITTDDNTLLVVQPRTNTKESVCVEFPAGYIEEGEDAIVAAKRELIEETGYLPERMILLGSYYQDQGCSSAYNHSFLAFNCQKKYPQKLDENEIIKYFECQYEEAIELAEMGYIKDINSLYALEKSKQYIRK